ncbi:MAG TPA: serine hydrolase [Candidatus Eremiobacteraceae bacterium]|nr:serine hydrolase [Candidatus Eremiobacteraceae bacterium]
MMTPSRSQQPASDKELDSAISDALDASGLREIAYAYVADLDAMRYGAYRADEVIYPASVIKVPIMAEAFRKAEAGELRLDDVVTVTQANQTTTWGGESPFHAGAKATVRDLVDRMITHSDNVATNQLFDVLRRERVTAFMRELGLPTFFLGRKLSGSEPLIVDDEMTGRNRLPPHEIGTLLTLIATDAVPAAARQREILRRCLHNEKLVPALREGDVFMHKTGETSDLSHDAGILKTAEGTSYVVVLYTNPESRGDDTEADHVNPQMTDWMRSLRARL